MAKLAYVVGPVDFVNMLGHVLGIDETFISGIGQYFLNAYIDSGEYEKNLENLKKIYERRLNLLCSCLDQIAEKGISYNYPGGGLIVWCTLDEDINERLFYQLACERKVIVSPGWIFYSNGRRRKQGNIRLCFSNVTEKQIIQGVELLGQVLEQCR